MDDVKVSDRITAGKKPTVPAAEFTHNFGRYKMEAQRAAVPVSSHGTLIGYFVSPQEYEYLLRLKVMRRQVINIADLPEAEAEAVFSGRMDPRHDHLNEWLDEK